MRIQNMAEEIVNLMEKVPILEKQQILTYMQKLEGGDPKVVKVANNTLHSLCMRRQFFKDYDYKYITHTRVAEYSPWQKQFCDMFWVVLEYMPYSTQFCYTRNRALPLFFIDETNNVTSQVCYIPAGQEKICCRRIYEETNAKVDMENVRYCIVENESSADYLLHVGFKYVCMIDHEAEHPEDKLKVIKVFKESERWSDMNVENLC